MRPIRRQRLYLIIIMLLGIGTAVAFTLQAFNDNLMFFFSPTDVAMGKAPAQQVFRLGGMVVDGSVERPGDDMLVRFKLTDYGKEVEVEYTGILPDLFREGQGVVTKGRLRPDGVFVAEEVLAKHDENYMPPEVADSLKKETVADRSAAEER